MESYKTRPIGEKFDCNGVRLEVIEEGDFACEGCYFHYTQFCCDEDITDTLGPCTSSCRDDEKDVIFKKVE